MIGYMWLNSAFFGLAPVFGWSEINYELTKTSCTVDFVNAGPGYSSFILSCFVLMFVGPILVMLFCVMSEGNNKEAKPEKIQEYAENDKVCLFLINPFYLLKLKFYIVVLENHDPGYYVHFGMDTIRSLLHVAIIWRC